ncbi:MAG: CDP-alcohol phosphatidyltransferase family protein [Oscillochloris sp.]|nr:CDP-alcohol phosphatidyltransferase family protein [Oscillochloris sp.]
MGISKLVRPRELLYPSNILTISRLGLVPLTIYYLLKPEEHRKALICLALTMFTDAIDGPIARARGEVSRLGEILDPIADKLLIDATAIILSRSRGFPWWATGLMLFRDIGILLAGGLVLRRRAHVTTAQSAGKATTVLMTLTVLLYLAGQERIGRITLTLAMIPFLFSFVQYGANFVALMRQQETPQPKPQ